MNNYRLLPLLIILALACQCSQIPTPEPTAVHTPVPSATMAADMATATTLANDFTPTPSHTPTKTPTVSISATVAMATETATPEPMATPSPTLAPSPVATVAQNYYIVQPDDWLIKIAQFLYGSQYGWEWRCLYEANKGTIGENPHLIYRGMKLEHIRECSDP